MNHLLSLNSPLQSIFSSKENTFLKESLLVVCGVLLLALSAHIAIPLQPVPLTFQSATVIFVGMALGGRLGAYTLIAYLIAGACGLPVFADMNTENNFFFGPTSGYLLAFLPAATLSGYLAQRGWAQNLLYSFLGACLGASIIFISGVSVLSLFIGWNKAIAFGLMPFIISEPLKLLAAGFVIPRFWKKTR